MKKDTTEIYRYVVDDVIVGVAPEFLAVDASQDLLGELRQRWEQKLLAQGLISGDGQPEGFAGAGPSSYEQKAEEAAEEDDEDYDDEGDDQGADESSQLDRKRKHPDDQQQGGPSQYVKHEDGLGADPIVNLIPQHDGPGDAEDAPGEGQGEEPNADEVLSEDDEQDNEEDEVVENLLLGQFDKVNKMKNRWKVNMRDCVFHINGKDHLFRKCTAEYCWD